MTEENYRFKVYQPNHLRDNAPYLVCSECQRKSWSDKINSLCNMPQPDGSNCTGVFILLPEILR